MSATELGELIEEIARLPGEVRAIVHGMSDPMLEATYREDGWTARQVVHHLPDSHMNAYVRMKLAVTEEAPTIRTYDEVRWAELPDAKSGPVDVSIDLLDALHRRWVRFLRPLSADELRAPYVHPELGRVPLDEAVAMYAWHGRHHAAHIRIALENSSTTRKK